jgi:hypothetical protein
MNAFEVLLDGRVFVYGVGGYNGQNAKTSGIKSVQEVITGETWANIVSGITPPRKNI